MQRNTTVSIRSLSALCLASFTSIVALGSHHQTAHAQFWPNLGSPQLESDVLLDPADIQISPTLQIPTVDVEPVELEPTPAAQADVKRFFIRFNDAYLVHEPNGSPLQIAAQNNVLSYGQDWDVVQLKPYLYHFRQQNWQRFYWVVNTSRKSVHRVNNGTFGELGGESEQLDIGVTVFGSPENPVRFLLNFRDAYLVRSSDGILQIAAQNNVLSYGGDWDVVQLKPYLFQLKQDVWKNFHWQVNTSRQVAERINGGRFGDLGGQSRDYLDVQIDAVY